MAQYLSDLGCWIKEWYIIGHSSKMRAKCFIIVLIGHLGELW